ncbi:response regulator [Seohaeicola saemankumensis]|uniref:Response regulator n=1 Tax=Seohaeicola saemankumensis TaxID=481181 RepID=A0ABW3TI25_9RHOB
MDDRDPFAPLRFPSAARPLLGLTVLLVEDSRFASEAMRLLCMRSGARIRRADCLRSARRHLQVYRPSVLIVDVGLPDGSGAELIAEAAQTIPRIGLIMGISGNDQSRDACLAAGADGFLEKPLRSIAFFQELILSHLPQDHQPPTPRVLHDETISPDTTAYRDDIAHVAHLLSAAEDDSVLDYVTQFLEGVAVLAGDTPLRAANQSVVAARAAGQPLRSDLAHLAGLLQDRIADRVAI